MELDCVVGSGPAGVACAAALLQRGRRVLMLDAGLTLEPERRAAVERLAAGAPHSWVASDLARIKEGMDPGASGVPQKLLFGSDYPYRHAPQELRLQTEGVGLDASLAQGGLSTVWGSAMLGYHERDLNGWPISAVNLAPHYRAIMELVQPAAGRDALEELFPLYADSAGELRMSRQAAHVWQKLNGHAARFRAESIFHGRARVAIRAAQGGAESGCQYCGQCMYGCPYGHIYNSASTVESWRQHPRFEYRSGSIVEHVLENGDEVTVRGRQLGSHTPFEVKVARVFLAAGVVPTTGILLRSLERYDAPVEIRDSQYFLLPALLTRGISGVRTEPLHALSQIFLEIMDPAVSANTVHLQLYTYNDLIGRAVRKMFGPLQRPLDWLAHRAEGRLILFQGFVHSNESSRIETTLRRSHGSDRLELRAKLNPAAREVVRRVARKLFRNSLRLGAVPVLPMLQFTKPGRSFHAGGSFPMSDQPGPWQTDRLGRPAGKRRIHAVDATVFPSIAATTITFTAMANAHRIASEAGSEGV